MKINLVVVGKQEALFTEAVLEFTKRIKRYSDFEVVETTDEKLGEVIQKYERMFLLDEKGKEFSTMEFSDLLQKQLNIGGKNMCFVIGGAYGFSAEVKEQANATISLSKLTFPHQLVRVIFLEQLYRAFTILNNEKYHHQ
ncbi:MAG TPA: 23S rRNA (pseudouridine(1915)-N(3))-methyltransferase RlmH [Candidatus Paceibacterota bacterium]